MTTKNWTTVAESSFPWEREALEFVRSQFPNHEPYRAWTNFEFVADDGSIYEVDLLIFTPQGFFLIEIKSKPGRLRGDAGTWTWETDGKLATVDNPYHLANSKAKKLRSLLQRQKAAKSKGQIPFIEALVFCSAENLQCDLQGNAKFHVCLRDRAADGTKPARPGIMAAIKRRECDGLDPNAKGTHDWVLLAEEGVGLRPALATVPSVTEVSRTSLLTGKLAQGHAPDEKVGFAEHPALLNTCRSGFPPVLFHKASLQETDDSSLAADIRKEIGSAHRKIVGVVVNAVDDHLLKGEQIDTRWSRDEIKVLPVLLHEAKMAGRTVILLSDHGHVLDCNAKGRQHEGGERWRFTSAHSFDANDNGQKTNDLEVGEILISGDRVVVPESKSLIAPWTEKIRYGIKKNGYHGGVSPQEMVVPIAVITSTSAFPPGWIEAPVDTPAWWEIIAEVPQVGPDDSIVFKPLEPKPVPDGMLFDVDDLRDMASTGSVASNDETKSSELTAEWINRLIVSGVYAEQKRICGRSAPSDDVVRRLLRAIDNRGGKITSVALARAIPMPLFRLPGLLAIAQRMFNIDGYDVLSRDNASDTIQLDRPLLLKQFDLVG